MRTFARGAALFTLLTIVMTWPQALRLGTVADNHQDVYFNMWRFGWVAHALAASPSHVLDGNIFYPERHALTFSDAIPLEALLAAPLLWSGVRPVLAHNLILLAGIVFSAAGIAMLARSLIGNSLAAITAGIVFAFAPYRFEHYMHMEMQWTVWIPWAFWALHRAIETAAWRDGLLFGIFVALQFMSSIYYGMFLAALSALVALLLLCGKGRRSLIRGAAALAIGGAVALMIVAPYAALYTGARSEVGGRSEAEVLNYSALPSSYLVATDGNLLYGKRSAPWGRPERRLFPGLLAMILALLGFLLRRPSDASIAYLIALVAAFEMSLGLHGFSFSFLYHHVPAFDALRAPARLGILVVFFLAILAAQGHAAFEAAVSKRWRSMFAIAIAALLLLEYWVAPMELVPFPNSAPPLYAWLARQPPGVIAEFPMSGQEPRYVYMSTFHWRPLLNGYSGNHPSSYLSRKDLLRNFPDETSLSVLRDTGVSYLVIHRDVYAPDRAEDILTRLSGSGSVTELGYFDDGYGTGVVFKLH